MKTSTILCCLVAGLLAGGDSRAVVLIGNLDSPVANSGSIIGTRPDNGATHAWDVTFNMSGEPYTLDSVVLTFIGDGSGIDGVVAGAPDISIWTDDGGGNLGSSLGSLNGAAAIPLFSETTNYTFTPSAGLDLLANQTYHLVVADAGAGIYGWLGTGPAVDPSGVAAFGQQRVSRDGAPYEVRDLRSRFEINATLVPEPSCLSLLGIGSMCFLLRRRK